MEVEVSEYNNYQRLRWQATVLSGVATVAVLLPFVTDVLRPVPVWERPLLVIVLVLAVLLSSMAAVNPRFNRHELVDAYVLAISALVLVVLVVSAVAYGWLVPVLA